MIKIALLLFVLDLCPDIVLPTLLLLFFIGYFNNINRCDIFKIHLPPTRLHALTLIYLLLVLTLFGPFIRVSVLVFTECICQNHIP